MSGAFPGYGATIYRNEAGEVLGWDNDYGYEPEYDPDLGMGDDYGPEWCRGCGEDLIDDPVKGEHCPNCYDDEEDE